MWSTSLLSKILQARKLCGESYSLVVSQELLVKESVWQSKIRTVLLSGVASQRAKEYYVKCMYIARVVVLLSVSDSEQCKSGWYSACILIPSGRNVPIRISTLTKVTYQIKSKGMIVCDCQGQAGGIIFKEQIFRKSCTVR